LELEKVAFAEMTSFKAKRSFNVTNNGALIEPYDFPI